jgi:tetratricopeptide (TPR) repeat protein
MKIKHIVLATTMMATLSNFAQKDELKALKKIYAKEEIVGSELAEYKSLLSKVEPLAIEENDKIYANFYKCMLPILEISAIDKSLTPMQVQMQLVKLVNPKTISELAVGLNATLDYEKKSGKKIYTDDINETISSYKPNMLNMAVSLGNANKYKEASQVLYSIYQLDKKDMENLYYAASYAVNGKDYEAALDYYNQLKILNYSGEGITYVAKNLASGNEDSFKTKAERDNLVSLKTHSNPREEKTPSRRGEIYKNIALILVEEGKNDEAKTAISEARKLNPEDTSLITVEAELYFKIKDYVTYKKLINEALEKNPNDVNLIFNLGIVSTQTNNLIDAEKFYLKVIEIDPKYLNAYINLAELKLSSDPAIVEEMNKLTTSDKDNKRYEVLKKNRTELFKNALPYYEKAFELDAQNEIVRSNLLSVYNFLEMTDKYKELKAKN